MKDDCNYNEQREEGLNMKIKRLILKDFRSFYGETEIPLSNFTAFIGKNDQGKSSILEALDIFVNEGKGVVKLDPKDLNVKAQSEGKNEFSIGVVFEQFPDQVIVDATNKTSLKEEYLLNADGDLEIWKTFRSGKLQSTAINCNHPSNDEFLMSLLNKKIKELQSFADEHGLQISDKRKAALIRKSIRDYYEGKDGRLNLSATLVPIDAEGLKEIWEKVKIYLPIYALFHADRKNVDQDDEIQDPLKVKVEEIFKRDNIQGKLNEIAHEIDTEIKIIAESTVEKIKLLTENETQIIPNIPEVGQLKWKDVYKGIGYNTNDDIPLNKRGSGIRRLVLLSSFLAESEKNQNANDAHVIYAIEEPETSLHPELQLQLINALTTLSDRPKYQVIITTHSPSLLRLIDSSNVRFVEQANGVTKVMCLDNSILPAVIKTMGLLPTISKVVICVEGNNDKTFLRNINQVIGELKQIIDLDAHIEAGLLAIVPMNGANLKDWIDQYVLKNTKAIEFHLYDSDQDQKYKAEIEKVNKRKDGSKGFLTQKREIENYVPKSKIEAAFDIKIDIASPEEWDQIDVPRRIAEFTGRKEEQIKKTICGEVSRLITKDDLISLNAWDEVKGWFENIKKLVDKVCQVGDYDN